MANIAKLPDGMPSWRPELGSGTAPTNGLSQRQQGHVVLADSGKATVNFRRRLTPSRSLRQPVPVFGLVIIKDWRTGGTGPVRRG
jgi:hypothetical protein